MFCGKCGHEFSDELDNCPFCLEPVKKEKKKFLYPFSDEGMDEIIDILNALK